MKEDGGDCYVKNGRVFTSMDWENEGSNISRDAIREGKIVIVHGAPTLRGGPYTGNKFGHCWIESEDTVYDYSNGNSVALDKRVYYALGDIDPSENVSYKIDEYRKKLVDEGTWGPWEGPSPELEWLTESTTMQNMKIEEVKKLHQELTELEDNNNLEQAIRIIGNLGFFWHKSKLKDWGVPQDAIDRLSGLFGSWNDSRMSDLDFVGLTIEALDDLIYEYEEYMAPENRGGRVGDTSGITESSKFPVDDKEEIGQKEVPLSRKEIEELSMNENISLYESRKKKKEPLFKDYNDFFWTDQKDPPEHVVQPQKNDKGYEYMKKEWNKQHKKFDTGYFGQ